MQSIFATNIPRILIVRLGAMGDVLHALPAVSMLRSALPGAVIDWAIEERWVELLANRASVAGPRSPQKPLVDRIHLVNTKRWRAALWSDETWKEILQVRKAIQSARYDVAIDFQGAWKSAVVVQLSGAHDRFGFRSPRERGASLFYTQRIQPEAAHIVEQNIQLMLPVLHRYGRSHLNPGVVMLPTDAAIETWCEKLLRERGLQQFAILNPGAGWDAKQWPPEKYAEVARGLAELGLKSVINFGPGEAEIAQSVEEMSEGSATSLSCSIGELIAVTRRAKLFVGGDTGPMHLAASLAVPVVGIFGPTDPARNGPFGTQSIVLRRSESVTNHSRRAGPDEAMLGITAAEVLDAARKLLQSGAREMPHA